MRAAIVAAGCMALWGGLAESAPRTNVVTQSVRGIRAGDGEKGTAVLVVFVVDDAGDPIDSVRVELVAPGREALSEVSDGRGRALFHVPISGPVTVRVSEPGFVTTLARGVVLRKGGTTAVALPLEETEPGKPAGAASPGQ